MALVENKSVELAVAAKKEVEVAWVVVALVAKVEEATKPNGEPFRKRPVVVEFMICPP